MHKHLTWTDRLKIEKGLREGMKPLEIAARLHVHNTTIYRELKRGRYTHLNSDLTTEERYSPEIAEQRYRENLKAKGGELKIGNDHELAAFIEKKIGEEGYSPAAVVGEIKQRSAKRRFITTSTKVYFSVSAARACRITESGSASTTKWSARKPPARRRAKA